MKLPWCIILLSIVSLLPDFCHAADWLQFRGANASGLIVDSAVPDEWSEDSNLKWKKQIEGEGWSAPIVVGKKVFLTTAISKGEKSIDSEHDWQLQCLDLDTGDLLWSKSALSGKPKVSTHRDNTYASETPVSDGHHVVAYFGMSGIFCYDLDGNQIWNKDLGHYPMQADWGTSSSPVIFKNLVYIQVDNQQSSFLVALDIATGNEQFRIERDEKSNWASPVLWTNAQRSELVTSGKVVRSYNPQNGELYWQLALGDGGVISTPTGDENVLIVGNQGFGGGAMYAVRAGAEGLLTLPEDGKSNQNILWSTKEFGPQKSSPLLYQGQIFLLGQRGPSLTCVDAATGKKIYQERIPDAAAFWASPWAQNGKVFCPDENGKTFVLQLDDKLNVVRTNALASDDGERFWATSAASNGTLLIRSSKQLYAIGTK